MWDTLWTDKTWDEEDERPLQIILTVSDPVRNSDLFSYMTFGGFILFIYFYTKTFVTLNPRWRTWTSPLAHVVVWLLRHSPLSPSACLRGGEASWEQNIRTVGTLCLTFQLLLTPLNTEVMHSHIHQWITLHGWTFSLMPVNMNWGRSCGFWWMKAQRISRSSLMFARFSPNLSKRRSYRTFIYLHPDVCMNQTTAEHLNC